MTTPPASPLAGPPGTGWALVRADGVIAAADTGFAARFGAASTDVVGRSWRDLVTPDGQRTLAEIERAVRAGHTWRGRVAGRTSSGAVDLEIEAAPSGRDASISLRITGAATVPAPAAAPVEAPPAPPAAPAPATPTPETEAAPPASTASADASVPARSVHETLEEAAIDVPFDWAVVLRTEDGGRNLVIVEAYPGSLAGADDGVRWSPPDTAERAVIESGEPAIEGTLAVRRGDTSPLARLPAYGMRSAIRVPLFAAGEVSGLVAVYSMEQEAFTVADALRLERAVRGLSTRAQSAATESPTTPPQTTTAEAPSLAEQFDRLGTLSEVMAGVAHELNNPLTAVAGYAQTFRTLPPAEQARAAEIIEREALRAGRIVRNLLAFAQRHPPELTDVDLNAVVQRVLDLKRYALQMDNIAIEVQQVPLPPLRADAHQLEQAVLNVVNNAHQAMTPGGGTLRLRTALGGDRARVIVEDTGPGVPPEFATRVFDPFFTTRGVGGGAGLGLAVVFGTVSAHGGRVWVEPAPGRGARFVIELPVAAPVEAPSAEPAAPETPASPARAAGQRVLIVDDEESIRVLASQVLTAYGYEPVAAASATEALALLDERPFEAVLTDIRMPGMDGIEFYGELARRWPALASHVVIMTGDVENDAVARLIREHALASLEKPFKLEALLAALATAAAPRQN